MNIYFGKTESFKSPNKFWVFGWGILLAVLVILPLVLFSRAVGVSSVEVSEETPASVSTFSIIEEVALSYGIPVQPMERLAEYLKVNGFNDKYGGVGVFCIKPSHLGWLSGSVLANTNINLEDELQNAQVAAFLLKRFRDSGYSWENCFVAYVFGVSAINSGNYIDFVSYLFSEDL